MIIIAELDRDSSLATLFESLLRCAEEECVRVTLSNKRLILKKNVNNKKEKNTKK